MTQEEYKRMLSEYEADLRQRSDEAMRKGRSIQAEKLSALKFEAERFLAESAELTEERARAEARARVYAALEAVDFEDQINSRKSPLYEKGSFLPGTEDGVKVADRVWSFLECGWMYLIDGRTDYLTEKEVTERLESVAKGQTVSSPADGLSEGGVETLGELRRAVNDKTGKDVWTVRIEERLEREEWAAAIARASECRGYYYKKGGCFVFQSEAEAEEFNTIKTYERKSKTSAARDEGIPSGSTLPTAGGEESGTGGDQSQEEQRVSGQILDLEEKIALDGGFSAEDAKPEEKKEAETESVTATPKTKAEGETDSKAKKPKAKAPPVKEKTEKEQTDEILTALRESCKSLTVTLSDSELTVRNGEGAEVVSHRRETDEVMKLLLPVSHREEKFSKGYSETLAWSSLEIFGLITDGKLTVQAVREFLERGIDIKVGNALQSENTAQTETAVQTASYEVEGKAETEGEAATNESRNSSEGALKGEQLSFDLFGSAEDKTSPLHLEVNENRDKENTLNTNQNLNDNGRDNEKDKQLPRGGGLRDTGSGNQSDTDRPQGDGAESQGTRAQLPDSPDKGDERGGVGGGVPDNGRAQGKGPLSSADGGGASDAASGREGVPGGGGEVHASVPEGEGVSLPDGLNEGFWRYRGEIEHLTPTERMERNVRAIEALAALVSEGRDTPTAEEREAMSYYSGWGGLEVKHRYDNYGMTVPESERHLRLHTAVETLDPDGRLDIIRAMMASMNTAYYTGLGIASTIASFAVKEGFRGGRMLDPSTGSGHFEGALPEEILSHTEVTGCEPDYISALIARYLYPGAKIEMNTLQGADLDEGSFDLVMTNDPFDRVGVTDKRWLSDMTPARETARHSLHGYFTVKKIEMARPGGLVNYITTSAVMDSEAHSEVRRYIADNCEIVGACRMPSSAFSESGTGVVTDVLFLRKFSSDDERREFLEDRTYRKCVLEPFLSQAEKGVEKDGRVIRVKYNAYYEANPESLLGEIGAGGQYSADEFTLRKRENGKSVAEELSAACDRVLMERRSRFGETIYTAAGATAYRHKEGIDDTETPYREKTGLLRTGNLVIQDGKVGILRIHEDMYGNETAYIQCDARTSGLDLVQTRLYMSLRDSLLRLMEAQLHPMSYDTAVLRRSLHAAYGDYTAKYRRLYEQKSRPMRLDVSASQVFALEKTETLLESRDGEDEKRERRVTTLTGMADIYERDIEIAREQNIRPDTPDEALAQSLSRFGGVDEEFMKDALGDDWEQACGERIFRTGETSWETSGKYLSGDVVAKLEKAEQMARSDLRYARNADALRAVLPKKIEFGSFPAHMGARWIPVEVYNDFMHDLFGARERWHRGAGREMRSGIDYYAPISEYTFNWDTSEFGGEAFNWQSCGKKCTEVFEAALTDKDITVYFPHAKDEKPVIDRESTKEVAAKVQDLKDEFENWLATHPEQVEKVEREYNSRFNRIVLPHWNGQHLQVPGLTGFKLHPHQKDAVWMLLNNKGGIVDHMVGAGKTLVMQTAVMEMRRLGIAKKPMMVVWKSTLEQLTQSFQAAFPSARILSPDKRDFTPENRDNFFAQIALNDYDCIIVTHEQFQKFNHTKEARTSSYREQLSQLTACFERDPECSRNGSETGLSKKKRKRLERMIETLRKKIQEEEARQDNCKFYFEKMGIDCLFVDESHGFKNLRYYSQYDNVAGLGTQDGSEKANNLLIAIRHIQRLNGGDRGVVFLSGTTISNSLTEMYNIFNYLRPALMRRLGLNTFDAWASTFARRSTEAEFGVTTELKPRTRFRRFEAVKELSAMYNEIADVRNSANLKLPRPEERTHLVTIDPSETVLKINEEIIRMVKNEDGSFFGIVSDEKTPWGLLAANLGKKLTVSPKLIDPKYDDERGKIYNLCENVKAIYDRFAEQKGTQLIFLDTGVDHGDGAWNAYSAIVESLTTEYGIPRSEVADIHEADSEVKRKSLFERVNRGEVRVLLGGTKNMGTGVNVQKRVTAMHHVDIPWTPSDVEQRNGRGVRQGNEIARDFNDGQVDVYYYAVKRTIDTYRYQLQETKGKMISLFKNSAASLETFDEGDGDDESVSWATMISILSGNPVILEKKKCEDKVEGLERRKRGFLRDQAQKSQLFRSLTERREKLEELVRGSAEDVSLVERNGYVRGADGEYPGVKVKLLIDWRESGEYVLGTELGEAMQKAMIAGRRVELKAFGVEASVNRLPYLTPEGRIMYEMQTYAASSIQYAHTLPSTPIGWAQAFLTNLKKITTNGGKYRNELEDTLRKLQGAPRGDGRFPLEDELREAKEKLREVTERYEAMVVKEEQTLEKDEEENETLDEGESFENSLEVGEKAGAYSSSVAVERGVSDPYEREALRTGGFTGRMLDGAVSYTAPDADLEAEYVGNLRESRNTRTGERIWIVEKTRYVTREEFAALCLRAKECGGYYSSFALNRGFIFHSEADAAAFNLIEKAEAVSAESLTESEKEKETITLTNKQEKNYEIPDANGGGAESAAAPGTGEDAKRADKTQEKEDTHPAKGDGEAFSAGERELTEEAIRETRKRIFEYKVSNWEDSEAEKAVSARLDSLVSMVGEATGGIWQEKRENREVFIGSDVLNLSLTLQTNDGRIVSFETTRDFTGDDTMVEYTVPGKEGEIYLLQKFITNSEVEDFLLKAGIELSLDGLDPLFNSEETEKKDYLALTPEDDAFTTCNEGLTEDDLMDTSEKADRHGIQDFGEKIWGARKDMYSIDTSEYDNISELSLASNPLSKVFREPDMRKYVNAGQISAEDAVWAYAMTQCIKSRRKPAKGKWSGYKVRDWAGKTYKDIETLRRFLKNEDGERERIKAEALAENEGKNQLVFKVKLLEALGYTVGDKTDTNVVTFSGYSSGRIAVESVPADKRVLSRETMTVDEAAAETARAIDLHEGRFDRFTLDAMSLTVKHTRGLYKPVDGKFDVSYMKGMNSYGRQESLTRDEAAQLESKMKDKGYYVEVKPSEVFDRLTDYEIFYRDPFNGCVYMLTDEKFDTADAARDYALSLDEGEIDRVIKEKISERMPKKVETPALAAEAQPKEKEVKLPKIKFMWRHYLIGENGEKETTTYRVATILCEAKDMPTGEEYVFRQFDSTQKGWDYMREHTADMQEELRTVIKGCGKKVKTFFEPNKERIGEDYRKGEDITPEKLSETFGFRGVQFGNWANDRDRQKALNETYDAMMDLMKVLGFTDPRMMSLSGELGMAFGARGGGNFNAHYELTQVVINLTKTKGAGSLAHEWMHAVDNYLSRHAGDAMGMISDKTSGMVRDIETISSWSTAALAINAKMKESNYERRCLGYGDYWNRPHEKWARLFAEWVGHRLEETGERNHYLSRGIEPEMFEQMMRENYELYRITEGSRTSSPLSFERYKESGRGRRHGLPYPDKEESLEYTPLFRDFFKAVGERIKIVNERRETEREMMLTETLGYPRFRLDTGTDEERERKADAWRAISDALSEAGVKTVFYTNPDAGEKGYYENGKLHINREAPLSLETPIHEYTHLWCAAMQRQEPAEWEHIKSLLRGTAYWEAVRRDANYKGIRDDDDRMASETLARISGWRGAEMMTSMERENGETEARCNAMRRKAVSAIKRFWHWTAENLFGMHFRPRNAEEAADMVISDLLSGSRLVTRETRKMDREYTRLAKSLSDDSDNGSADKEQVLDTMQKAVARAASDALSDSVARDGSGALNTYLFRTRDYFSLLSGRPVRLERLTREDASYLARRRNCQMAGIEFTGLNKETEERLREYTRPSENSSHCYINLERPVVLDERKVSGMNAEEIMNVAKKTDADCDGVILRRLDGGEDIIFCDILQWHDATALGVDRGAGKLSERYRAHLPEREWFITGGRGAAALDTLDHTHRLDDLRIALQCEKAGWSEADIKAEWWWERGLDGRWMYEVPVSDFTRIEEAIEKYKTADGRFTGEFTLDDVPELRRLYPQESLTLEVIIDPDRVHDKGTYYVKTADSCGKIVLNLKNTKALRAGILHEAQHFAQDMEGMAMGASLRDIRRSQERICAILRILPSQAVRSGLVSERMMMATERDINEINRICAAYATDCQVFIGTSAETLYRTCYGEAMARASVRRTLTEAMALEESYTHSLISESLDTEGELMWTNRGQSEMNWVEDERGFVSPQFTVREGDGAELQRLKAELSEAAAGTDRVTFFVPLTEAETAEFLRHGYSLPPVTEKPITTTRQAAREGVPLVLSVTLPLSDVERRVRRNSSGDGYVIAEMGGGEFRLASMRQSNEPRMFSYRGMMFCRQTEGRYVTREALEAQTRTMVKAIERVFPSSMRGKVKLLSHEDFEALGFNLSDNLAKAVAVTDTDGTVYIDVERARVDTPLHELGVHRLMDIARQYGLTEIESTILRYGETAPETIKREVARLYPELSPFDSEFREECAAMAFGLQQEYRLAEFLQTKASEGWFERLTGYVTDVIEKIKGKILGKQYADLTPLQCIERLSHEAIGNRLFALVMQGREIRLDPKKKREVEVGQRAQVIGLKGIKRLAMDGGFDGDAVLNDGLTVRGAMEKYLAIASSANAGDDKLLRLATGMFYGPLDRKPRMEILSPQIIPDEELKEKLDSGEELRLGDILVPGSALLAAYPELSSAKITGAIRENISSDFANIQKEYSEVYDESVEGGISYRIAVFKPTAREWRESVEHELQHAVQAIEGFDEGYPFTTPLKAAEIEFLKQKAASMTASQLRNLASSVTDGYLAERGVRRKAMGRVKSMLRLGKTRLERALAGIEESLRRYTLSAGENEAYAVSKRSGLDKAERASRPLSADYFVDATRQEGSPLTGLLKRTGQAVGEYNLFTKDMKKDYLTFAEQRQRVSIIEIAQHYGYRILPRQGVRCPILLHEQTGDRIGILNPANPASQGFWTIGDDTSKGVLYNFVASRVAMGIIPNTLPYPESQNPNFVVNKVVHDYLSIPFDVRSRNQKLQEGIAVRLETTGKATDFTRYTKDVESTGFLSRRALSDETILSPAFRGRYFSLNSESMLADGLLGKEADADTICFPLWNAKGDMVGLERRCDDVKMFITGSQKAAGVWHSNIPQEITDVVICETPLDCMAYHELRGGDSTLYFATAGNVCTEQINQINEILKANNGRINAREFTVHLANDNDRAGAGFNLLYVKAQMRLKKGCAVDAMPTVEGYQQTLVSYRSKEERDAALEALKTGIEARKEVLSDAAGEPLVRLSAKNAGLEESIIIENKSNDMFALSALGDILIETVPLVRTRIEQAVTKDFNDDLKLLNRINEKDGAVYSYEEFRMNKTLFTPEITEFLRSCRKPTKAQKRAKAVAAYLERHKASGQKVG